MKLIQVQAKVKLNLLSCTFCLVLFSIRHTKILLICLLQFTDKLWYMVLHGVTWLEVKMNCAAVTTNISACPAVVNIPVDHQYFSAS